MGGNWHPIHRRIVKKYGKASLYICTDCPKDALDWSHIHGMPIDDMDSYTPRCRSCHRKYDYNDEWKAKLSLARMGNSNQRRKLSGDLVLKVRELYATGQYTHVQLGNIFGVHSVTIGEAIRGDTWRM